VSVVFGSGVLEERSVQASKIDPSGADEVNTMDSSSIYCIVSLLGLIVTACGGRAVSRSDAPPADSGAGVAAIPDAGTPLVDSGPAAPDATMPVITADAGQGPTLDASGAGGEEPDATVDAGEDAGLLAACASGNVMYLNIVGSGPFATGPVTYNVVPFYDFGNVDVIATDPPPYYGISIQQTDSWKMQAGVFELTPGPGLIVPLVEVATQDSTEGCYSTNGTINIVEVDTIPEEDAGVGKGQVISFLASFEMHGCELPTGDTQEFSGCVRIVPQ
jgi:hypothetical protein